MAANGQQQQQAPVLIRPAQIDNLPYLDANVKAQYKSGLANLWGQYESNAEGTPERQAAFEKIKTASSKLMSQLASRQRPNSQQGQPQQRPGQPQQGGPQQQMGQQQQGGMTPQQAQQMRIQAEQRMQQQQQAGGDQSGQMQQPQQGGQQQIQLSQKSQDEMNSVVLNIPQAQQPAWRNTAMTTLYRRENIFRTASALQQQLQALQKSGQQIPDQLRAKFDEARKGMDTINRQWNVLKARGEGQQVPGQAQANGAQQNQQQNQQQTQQQNQQQRPGTQQGQVNAQQNQVQQQQQQQPDVKPAEQRTSASPPQPQGGFQQNNQNQNQQAPAQNQQNKPPLSQPQLQAQPQQNMSQQNNMQQQGQQQARPQINTQMANAQMGPQQQQPQQQQPPQQGAPNNAIPNSASQHPPQRPQALTQQAAISQAAEYSRSQQQMQQQGQQPPQVPNGLPFSTQPNSGSQQNTPTYPNLQTTQQSSANTKFPIPKTLALDPRTQTPVQGPASRPTMQNTGMMYNPGIQRQPPFTLEGEGDRVLSKRKLDELVRQVTGSAPHSTTSSDGSNVLTPEVEEAMLELADDFVDNLVTQACKLAKLRQNQTLDLRDVQIVLERNYGIRVPGYALDEARTVKKFVPAAGWQQKMQAVQAGKVMGSKDS